MIAGIVVPVVHGKGPLESGRVVREDVRAVRLVIVRDRDGEVRRTGDGGVVVQQRRFRGFGDSGDVEVESGSVRHRDGRAVFDRERAGNPCFGVDEDIAIDLDRGRTGERRTGSERDFAACLDRELRRDHGAGPGGDLAAVFDRGGSVQQRAVTGHQDLAAVLDLRIPGQRAAAADRDFAADRRQPGNVPFVSDGDQTAVFDRNVDRDAAVVDGQGGFFAAELDRGCQTVAGDIHVAAEDDRIEGGSVSGDVHGSAGDRGRGHGSLIGDIQTCGVLQRGADCRGVSADTHAGVIDQRRNVREGSVADRPHELSAVDVQESARPHRGVGYRAA